MQLVMAQQILEDATQVCVVESGAEVTAAQAELCPRSIKLYGGDIDISDTAAALISAGDHVLNVTGVDTVMSE